MTDGTFTQDQVKHLIDIEGIKTKINFIVENLAKLSLSFETHAEKAEKEMDGLFEEIRKGEKDLMECRAELRDEVYNNFVQKKELRIWLAIAIFCVSAATGVIQWVVSNSDHKSEIIAEQIAEILKDHNSKGSHIP